jgi:alpha-glucosidase
MTRLLLLACLSLLGRPAVTAAEEAATAWFDEFDVNEIVAGFGSAQRNRSLSKKPLAIAGVGFQRGIGTHAPSQAYFLNESGGSLRFQSSVGLDDSADGPGSVTFQVVADDKVVHDTGIIRKGEAAKKIDVDLSGKKVIELRVTDGGDGKNHDHADWADAKFVHAEKAPVMVPRWAMELEHFKDRPVASPAVGNHIGDRLSIGGLLDGKPFLDVSPLGVTVDGIDLGKSAVITGIERYRTNRSYDWIGNVKSLRDNGNGWRTSLRSEGYPGTWFLELRAYDDGVAWRYIIPGKGQRKVTGEATSFVLPEGSTYWSHHNTGNYEANYLHFTPQGESPTRQITMPVTVELPGGAYACITEANMFGYSGMTLGPRGGILTGIFEDDPEGWTMEDEIITPWRIVIAAKDLTALVNQSIVYNVSPPPDAKLFPKGTKTDWIEPGRAFWTWGFGQWDTARWDRIKGFVDDAAVLNCQYFTIDDPWREPKMGWHRNGKDEWASLKEVCDYAGTKKVKIMVWEHWERLRDPSKREEFFEKVAKAGAVGVKIDFMDSESQGRLAFFKSCLEIAAKHKVMINFHGANKPAGEERTYPHWMTREAIYGMEQGGNIARPHLAALPFTRLVTGPADFTPMVFRADPMGKTTAGSQMATAVAYNSPLNHWADSARSYLAQPEEILSFIRSKPVVWDELRVLPGSKIGEIAALARRSGDQWWVAVINGSDQRKDYSFSLDFMGADTWSAVSFADIPGDKTKLEITRSNLKTGETVAATMEPGGGFVMILVKR